MAGDKPTRPVIGGVAVVGHDERLKEVRERLGGEDPLDPELRCSLRDALESLADLAEQLGEEGATIELDEPPNGEVQKYREVLHQ